MGESFVDTYWIPVGAGTRFQAASLVVYESVAALLARRRRSTLLHAALKVRVDGTDYVVELTPERREDEGSAPLVTGPVGAKLAGRLRLFRYELHCEPGTTIVDEAWAAGEPIRVTDDGEATSEVLAWLPSIPAHTWGRRAPRTREMWTSNSAVSWVFTRAGLDIAAAGPPPGTSAPGWQAGIDAARDA